MGDYPHKKRLVAANNASFIQIKTTGTTGTTWHTTTEIKYNKH